MTQADQRKQHQHEGVNPVVAAAVAGAVVGAGVVAAGAVALKDEKNRKKVKEVFNNAKDQAMRQMDHLRNDAEDKKKEAEKKVTSGKKEVDKIRSEARGSNTESKQTRSTAHVS